VHASSPNAWRDKSLRWSWRGDTTSMRTPFGPGSASRVAPCLKPTASWAQGKAAERPIFDPRRRLRAEPAAAAVRGRWQQGVDVRGWELCLHARYKNYGGGIVGATGTIYFFKFGSCL
jgi:hypothetical protein